MKKIDDKELITNTFYNSWYAKGEVLEYGINDTCLETVPFSKKKMRVIKDGYVIILLCGKKIKVVIESDEKTKSYAAKLIYINDRNVKTEISGYDIRMLVSEGKDILDSIVKVEETKNAT